MRLRSSPCPVPPRLYGSLGNGLFPLAAHTHTHSDSPEVFHEYRATTLVYVEVSFVIGMEAEVLHTQ